jgi:hypothetical protein
MISENTKYKYFWHGGWTSRITLETQKRPDLPDEHTLLADVASPASYRRIIWIDEALGGPARCRRLTLSHRCKTAGNVAATPLVDLHADRVIRIVSLGGCRRERRYDRNCKDRPGECSHRRLPGFGVTLPFESLVSRIAD